MFVRWALLCVLIFCLATAGLAGEHPCQVYSLDETTLIHRAGTTKAADFTVETIQGNVVVMRYHGALSDFEVSADHPLDFSFRQQLMERFYQQLGDVYDIVAITPEANYIHTGARAFLARIKNDTEGLGLPIVDLSNQFHSQGKLQGIIELGGVEKVWSDGAFNHETFRQIMLHELGHRWLANVSYLTQAGQISSALMMDQPGHWSFLLDSEGSYMYGHDWQQQDDRHWTVVDARSRYSKLDLYLMGMLPATAVGPITLLHAPSVPDSSNRLPIHSGTFAANAETIDLSQIIAVEGPRIPAYANQPKTLRVAAVYLYADQAPSSDLLEALNSGLASLDSFFQRQTLGLGHLDFRPAPYLVASASPDSTDALNFLALEQDADGLWADHEATRIRDSVEVIRALALYGRPYGEALDRLAAWTDRNLDEKARIAALLAEFNRPSDDRIAALLAAQAENGGFALRPGSGTNPFDTALALSALVESGEQTHRTAITDAVAYLLSTQKGGQAWGQGQGTAFETAAVLEILTRQSLVANETLALAKARATTWLLSFQGAHGGLGQTDIDYSVTCELQRSLALLDTFNTQAQRFLAGSQATNGSWNHTVHDTALVLNTLHLLETLQVADVGLDPASLIYDPTLPIGQAYPITAMVTNYGNAPAEQVSVTLYLGDPDHGGLEQVRADLSVPLLPGESRQVQLVWQVPGGLAEYVAFLVASSASPDATPANDRIRLQWQSEATGPDVLLDASHVVISSTTPTIGEAVDIRARIFNAGTATASELHLTLYDGNPDHGGTAIQTTTLPDLAAGQQFSHTFSWVASAPLGPHNLTLELTAAQDARPENNRYLAQVLVGQVITGVDLGINPVSAALSPDQFTAVPQAFQVAFNVASLGQTIPEGFLATWYQGPPAAGVVLASQTASFAGQSSVAMTLQSQLSFLSDYDLYLVVTPNEGVDQRPENNQHLIHLAGLAQEDFEADSLTAAPLVTAQAVQLEARITNRNLQPRTGVAVAFEVDTGAGFVLVGRDTLNLPGGGVGLAHSRWTAPTTPVSGSFRITVDPDQLVAELDETDNSATLSFTTQLDNLANPYLAEDALSFSASPYHESGAMQVHVRVQNLGALAASGQVALFLDNEQGGQLAPAQSFAGLSSLGELMLSFTVDPIKFRGNHLIMASLTTAEPESNSADNTAFKSIYVVGGPNPRFAATPLVLNPSWPGVGEQVTVTAKLENTGALAAQGLVVELHANGPAGPLLGQATLDLPQGARSLDFHITATSEVTRLVCLLDPAQQNAEQVETDNTAALGLILRRGDIAVDEPIFSPNGDGIKDQVSLFWSRPESELTVTLTNSRGQALRTWPAQRGSGSLVWNGRDSQGKLLPDDFYLFRLIDPLDGMILRDQAVTIDMNNSRITAALATSDPGFYNLVDSEAELGENWFGWAADASSLLAHSTSSGPALYVAPDGSSSAVLGDDPSTWAFAAFSLDGLPGQWLVRESYDQLVHYANGIATRHFTLGPQDLVQDWLDLDTVLVWDNEELLLLDLGTGARTACALPGRSWGEFRGAFVYDKTLFALEGNEGETRILSFAADGSDFRLFKEWPTANGTTLQRQGPFWMVELDGASGREIVFLDLKSGQEQLWSSLHPGVTPPYGEDFFSDGRLYRAPIETGSPDFVVIGDWTTGRRFVVRASTVAILREAISPDGTRIATGRFGEFGQGIYTTRHNLGLDFEAFLTADGAVQIQGSAVDRNFLDWQLDYAAVAQPDLWLPTGMHGAFPIVDALLGVWVPEQPGTYLLRLTARDRAGNAKQRLALVEVVETLPFFELLREPMFISPNNDGVADTVSFTFQVRDPFEAEVVVYNATGVPVRRMVQFFGTAGAGFHLSWNGRNDLGQVVADGIYRISFNGLSYSVRVDTTLPEVGLNFLETLRTTTGLRTQMAFHVYDANLLRWRLERRLLGAEDWILVESDTHNFEITSLDGLANELPTLDQIFEQEFRLVAEDISGNVATLTRSPQIQPHIWTLRSQQAAYEGDTKPLATLAYGGIETVLLASTLPSDRYPLTLAALEYSALPAGLDTNPFVVEHPQARQTLFQGPVIEPGLTDANLPPEPELYFRLVFTDALGNRYRTETLRRISINFQVELIELAERPQGDWQVGYRITTDADTDQLSGKLIGLATGPRFEKGLSFGGHWSHAEICLEAYACEANTTWPDADPPSPGHVFGQWNKFVLDDVVLFPNSANRIELGRLVSNQFCISAIDLQAVLGCRQPGSARPFSLEFPFALEGGTIRFFVDPAGAQPISAEYTLAVTPLAGPKISIEFDDSALPVTGWNQIYAVLRDSEGRNVIFNPKFKNNDHFTLNLIDPGDAGPALVQAAGMLYKTLAPVQPQIGDQVLCAASALEIEAWQKHKISIPRTLSYGLGRHMGYKPFLLTEYAASILQSPLYRLWTHPEGQTTPIIYFPLQTQGNTTLDIGKLLGFDRWIFHLQAVNESGYCDETTATVSFSDLGGGLESAFELLPGATETNAVFSPNGDNVQDNAQVRLRVKAASQFAAWVETLEGEVVSVIKGGNALPVGLHTLIWNGRNSDGMIVADGTYRLIVVAYTACGASNEASIQLVRDTQAPQAAIDLPLAGPVRLPTALLVSANDEHGIGRVNLGLTDAAGGTTRLHEDFALPRLDRQALPAPLLAPGNYTLTWLVVDRAGNSTTTTTQIQVERNLILESFQSSIAWISPNGDTIQDGTVFRFTLAAPAHAVLELVEQDGLARVWPLYEQDLPAGAHEVYCDGKSGGTPLADGVYRARLRIEQGPTLEYSELEVHIDRVAPVLAFHQPFEGGVYDLERQSVVVSVSDAGQVKDWQLDGSSASHPRAELAAGHDALNFAVPAEVQHPETGINTLYLAASDFAGNSASLTRDFVRDPFAPIVAIDQPSEGQLYGPDQTLAASGTFQEPFPKALELYLEDQEGSLTPLRTFAAAELLDGVWSFSTPANTLPDGTYKLVANMEDVPGHRGESSVAITIDTHPPTVALEALPDGGVLTGPVDLRGTVRDAALVSWELAIAPRSGGAFTTFFSDTREVVQAKLYRWSVLPSDGTWRLRLRAFDRAGQMSEVFADVLVDQTPPPAPAELMVQASQYGNAPNRFSKVKLSWPAVSDPGLSGYLVYRDGIALNAQPLQATTWTDDPVPDGDWRYEVRAVDLVGNRSTQAAAEVTLDTLPPQPNLASPHSGEAVGGLVAIVGSVVDARLADWRLEVGAGLEPLAWETLLLSTESIAYGELFQWPVQNLAPGPYQIRLRARDSFGNVGDAVVAVVVENQIPGKPATPAVSAEGPGLLVSWSAHPETDIDHYRLYRNDSFVATVPATATTYLDALPDGRYSYRLVAVDFAGNRSPLSDPSEAFDLDLRPPHVSWINPSDQARFETDMTLEVFSADRDILSVTFQYQSLGASDWTEIALDGELPWLASLTAANLAEGSYLLRAVAIERDSGEVDPDPEVITVTKGDATPPPPTTFTAHHINGAELEFTWQPVAASDLAGYRLFRDDAEVIDVDAQATSVTLHDAPYGIQNYRIAAFDQAGNLSSRSAALEVYVFQPTLDQSFALVEGESVTVSGSGEPSYAMVEVYEQGTLLTSAPVDALGRFQIELTLNHAGESVLTFVQVHPQGHRSLPAAMTALVPDQPLAVTNLQGQGDGGTPENAVLGWQPPSPMPSGYLVYADGQLLQGNGQASISSATTSSSSSTATRLFDGTQSTFWVSTSTDRTRRVTLNLAAPVAVSGLAIDWYTNFGKPSSVTVSARVAGYLLPIWHFAGNGPDTLDTLTAGLTRASVVTDQLVIDMVHTNRVGMREVRVLTQTLLPPAQMAFTHAHPGNGIHSYTVESYGSFGLRAPAGPLLVGIGDTTPPEPPTGLVAAVADSDVDLTWLPSPSPDTARYRVYRDGRALASPTAALHRDSAVHAGTYSYAVTAIDTSGNESATSAPATATVTAGVTQPPVLTAFADPQAGLVALAWQYDVSAPAFKTFRVQRRTGSGAFSTISAAILEPWRETQFEDSSANQVGTVYAYRVAAVDQQDRENFSNIVTLTLPMPEPDTRLPAPLASSITVFEDQALIVGQANAGARVGVYRDNQPLVQLEAGATLDTLAYQLSNQEPSCLAVSYDGAWFAFAALTANEITLYHTVTDTFSTVEVDRVASTLEFSPDGKYLAFIDGAESATSGMLALLELDTQTLRSPWTQGTVQAPLCWRASGALCFSTGTQVYAYDPLADSATRLASATDLVLIAVDWHNDRLILDSTTATGHSVQSVKSSTDTQTWLTVPQSYTYAWAASARQLFAVGPDGGVKVLYIGADNRPLSASLRAKGQLEPGATFLGITADARHCLAQAPTGELTLLHCGGDDLEFMDILGEDLPTYASRVLPSGEVLASYRRGQLFDLTRLRLPGYFQVTVAELEPGPNYLSFDAVAPATTTASPRTDQLILNYSQERLPDLQILSEDLRLIPAVAVPGQTTTVQANIRNLGGGDAADVLVRWSLIAPNGSRSVPNPDQVVAVPAHDLVTVGFNLPPDHLVPGTYTLVASVDPEQTLLESNTANNQASRTFLFTNSTQATLALHLAQSTLPPLGDLSFAVDLDNLGSTQHQVQVTAAIESNAGTRLARLDNWSIGDLASQAHLSHNWTWNTATLLAGSYKLHVILSAGATQLAEKTVDFEIMGDPRLTLALTGLPGQVQAGALLAVTARITNTSSNVAFQALTWRAELRDDNGALAATLNGALQPLLPGAFKSLPLAFDTTPLLAGPHALFLTVLDQGSVLADTEQIFVVLADPIYAAGVSLYASPANLRAGDDLLAEAMVRNLGNRELSLTTELTLSSPSGAVLASVPWSLALAPGQTLQLTRSFTTTGFERGTYRLRLFSTGTSGAPVAIDETALVQVIANRAPTLTVAGLPSQGRTDQTVTLQFLVDDDDLPLPIAAATLNGQSYLAGEPIPDEGYYTLDATVADPAGATDHVNAQFNIDRSAPVIVVENIAAGASIYGSIIPRIRISDLNLVTSHVLLNGVAQLSGQLIDQPGTYRLEVEAVDVLGHQNRVQIDFTLLPSQPLLALTGVADGGHYNQPQTVAVTLFDGATLEAFQVNGQAQTPPYQLQQEGAASISARATKNGLSQEVSLIALLDFTPPQVVVQGIQALGHYRSPVRPVVLVDGRPAASGLTLDGAPFTTGTEVDTEGTHQLRAQAVDQAGNLTDVSVQFTLDLSAPQLTLNGVQNGQVSPVNLLITWTATDPWLDGVSAFLDDQPVTSPLTVSSLGEHSLRVSARDRAGNSISRQLTFSRVQGRILSLTAVPQMGGTLSGAGVWAEGSQAPITASALPGYRFSHWAGEGVADPLAISTTVAMQVDRQLEAHFAVSYELVLQAEPADGGSLTGAGFYDQGSQAPISASPLGDYRFGGWRGEGVGDPAAAQTTVTMDAPRYLIADFHPNRAPLLAFPLADQRVAVDQPLAFTLPESSFSDPDGDQLTLTATLANGQPLPVWLSFDAAFASFSGLPLQGDLGTYELLVRAADDLGASVQDRFLLEVVANAPAAIAGSVFDDRNHNGRRDSGEAALAGRTLFLDQDLDGALTSGEPSTLTDASGAYRFEPLAAGTYTVRILPRSGWRETVDLAELLAPPSPLGLPDLSDMALDLLDGDAFTDLVLTHPSADHLTVLHGRGDGRFERPATLATPQGAQVVALGDFDGDAARDLVALSRTAATISLFRNLGEAGFAAVTEKTLAGEPDSLVAVDLDGDHDLDLAIANAGSGTIAVLLNENGDFLATQNYGAGLAPRQLIAADLDRDQLPELIVVGADHHLRVLANLGGAQFAPPTALTAGTAPDRPTALDWDGDGDLDLALLDGSDHTVTLLANDGQGNLALDTTLSCDGRPEHLLAADLDGDGDTDLLVGQTSPTALLFFENRNGSFAAPLRRTLSVAPTLLRAADLDADGDPDPLLLAGSAPADAYLLANGLVPTVTLDPGQQVLGLDFGQRQDETLTVTAPNGGELLPLCQAAELRWTTGGFPGDVAIELSRDGGSTYETLFAQTPNDGLQQWSASGTPSTDALIRITSLANGLADLSDAVFTLSGDGDQDHDCMPDNLDQCPGSNAATWVVINGCDSGVPNHFFASGCSFNDLIAQCAANHPPRWQFIGCVTALVDQWLANHLIDSAQRSAILACANEYGLPTAVADAYTTNWSTNLDVTAPGVLANDTDPDGDALQAHLLQQPAHGTLSLSQSGSFHYVPELGFAGSVTFVYKAWDGTGFRTAPVTITVTPGNLAPVTGNDHYTAQLNTRLVVSAPGVLANDYDPEGIALTAFLYQTPNVGTVGFSGDGGFWYDPPTNFTGPVSFLYRAGDGLQKTIGTVTIDVVAPAPSPKTSQKTAQPRAQ